MVRQKGTSARTQRATWLLLRRTRGRSRNATSHASKHSLSSNAPGHTAVVGRPKGHGDPELGGCGSTQGLVFLITRKTDRLPVGLYLPA